MEPELVVESTGSLVILFALAAMAMAMLGESLMPRRELQQGLLWRWTNNLSLCLISRSLTMVVGVAYIMLLSHWVELREIGLFQSVQAPALIQFLVLLLVSQFMSYWVHVAFHKFRWLWPIHAVHHSDVDVDVTTSYRHHPLESLISLPLITPIILLLGIPPEVAVTFKLFEISATLFSHSNIRIPQALEKYLCFVILTPDFHRLHHCSESRYTNSNYGSLLPWFDYLFNTASSRPYDDQEHMELGLEYLREPRDGRLDRLLWEPVLVSRYRPPSGVKQCL